LTELHFLNGSADDWAAELNLIGISQADEDAVALCIDSQLAVAGGLILGGIAFLEEKGSEGTTSLKTF
jgi:hypothetical protein